MINISFFQLCILFIFIFLLFGDYRQIKEKFIILILKIKNFLKNKQEE